MREIRTEGERDRKTFRKRASMYTKINKVKSDVFRKIQMCKFDLRDGKKLLQRTNVQKANERNSK